MANVNSVFGARFAGHLYGAGVNQGVHEYVVPATDNTALFLGDFVKVTGAGGNNELGRSLAAVTQAEAEDVLTGFVVGFLPTSDYLNQVYRSASTLRTALVCDDPYAIFEIQTSGTSSPADYGANADIVVGAGNTVFGTSGMQLDQTTVTPSTAQLRILKLVPRPDNEVGLYAKLLCMINEQFYKGTAGI